MGSCKIQCVLNAQWFLFDYIVDVFTWQSSTYMLGDLTNELVGDDGDVLDARAADGSKGVVDDRPLVDGQERFLGVPGEGRQAASVPARDKDGLDVHVYRTHVSFKAPPVLTDG